MEWILCICSFSRCKKDLIAAGTEYSILTQNCLAFLGYDTYLLGGQLAIGDKKEEQAFLEQEKSIKQKEKQGQDINE